MAVLCPMCSEPMSENEMCYECNCFFEKQEFIITDLYNYNARPQRSHHQLDHFSEVRRQFPGGKLHKFRRTFCTKSNLN